LSIIGILLNYNLARLTNSQAGDVSATDFFTAKNSKDGERRFLK